MTNSLASPPRYLHLERKTHLFATPWPQVYEARVPTRFGKLTPKCRIIVNDYRQNDATSFIHIPIKHTHIETEKNTPVSRVITWTQHLGNDRLRWQPFSILSHYYPNVFEAEFLTT